jgi:hypothetical protein
MMEEIGLEAVFKDEGFNKGITNYQNSVETASTKTGKFSGAMSAMGGIAKVGVLGVIGLAGAAVGAAAGLSKLVMSAADTAGDLVDMSLKTGIGVETLQELKYVGEQTGTSLESITGSMTKLKRAMGDVGTNKAMAENFEKLGVSVYDANGNLRKSEDVFNDTIAALGQMTNETERDSLAMDIFGRSAVELNPLIKAGADGIAALTAEAHTMGAVMGEDAVFGLEGFGDSVASLKAGFEGIVAQVGSAVLPIFVELINKLLEFVKSPEFQAGIQNLIKWLSEYLPVAIQFLSDFFKDVLVPAIQFVWDFIGEFMKVVSAWWDEHGATVIATIEGIWEVITEIYETARDAIENIVELFHLAQAGDWEGFGEKIREIVDTLWENIKTIFQDAIDAVIKFFTETDWGAVGTNIINGIVSGIENGAEWIADALLAAAKAAWEAIVGFFKSKSPSLLFEGLGENLMLGLALGITEKAHIPIAASQYAAMATTAPLATHTISNNRTNNVSINMGGVNITNGADHQAFISRVEWAVQRALGV